MTAQILDGKATAAAIKAELTMRVAALRERGIVPGLGTVLVGDDPGSQWYVAGQAPRLRRGRHRVDPPRPARDDLAGTSSRPCSTSSTPTRACTGYIVQLPLPTHIDTDAILELVDPDKDADGLHPTNLGRLVLNVNRPISHAAAVHAARRHRADAAPRDRAERASTSSSSAAG